MAAYEPKRGDYYASGNGYYRFDGTRFVWNGRDKGNGTEVTKAQAESWKPNEGSAPEGGAANEGPEVLSFSYLSQNDKPVSNVLSYPKEFPSNNVDYVEFIFKEYKAPFGLNVQNAAAAAGAASRSSYAYNASAQNLTDSGLPKVIMYMPEDIAARYGSEWGGKSIQNNTVEALKGFAAPGAKLKDVFTNWKSNAASTADSALTAIVSEGLSGLQKMGQGEGLNINDVFSSTKGIVINPNTELLFVGFNLRSFDLNFKMVARSSAEAIMIRDIITTFKKAMLPSQTGDSGDKDFDKELLGEGDRVNFIQVPNIVDVKFMHNGNVHEFLPQYKPCAITELSVNYTSDGTYATYKDGEPIALTMSLRFSETKLVYKEDVRYGGVSF